MRKANTLYRFPNELQSTVDCEVLSTPDSYLSYLETGIVGFLEDICPIVHVATFRAAGQHWLVHKRFPDHQLFNDLSNADSSSLVGLIETVTWLGYGMSDKKNDCYPTWPQVQDCESSCGPISIYAAADLFVRVIYIQSLWFAYSNLLLKGTLSLPTSFLPDKICPIP